MKPLNAIDLNRKFKEIAADLKTRKGEELRAKVLDGKTVLYSKKVTRLDKLVGNIFFDRASKRGAAQQLIFDCFKVGLKESEKSAILKPAYYQKPTAEIYEKVFDNASATMANHPRVLPQRFEGFLQLPDSSFNYFLPLIEEAAKARGNGSDLKFLLDVRRMASLDQVRAEELAARLAIRLINENYNVKGDLLKAFAGTFELDRAEAERLTPQDWTALIKGQNLKPQQLADLFKASAAELAVDAHNNFYKGKFTSVK